jgi:hypothetical protein
MKISAMILATLAATLAVIPASATSDENFVGQVANLEDVAAVASSPHHSIYCTVYRTQIVNSSYSVTKAARYYNVD